MKNIILLGLGAIGSLVASKFVDNEVSIDILLNEQRLGRYSKEKFYINNKQYDFSYITPESYNKKADLIIIATKYNQLSDSLEMLDNLVNDDCTIMSLLNGIDSEDIIGNKFGIEKCVYAL